MKMILADMLRDESRSIEQRKEDKPLYVVT